jgi:hypothetical protein
MTGANLNRAFTGVISFRDRQGGMRRVCHTREALDKPLNKLTTPARLLPDEERWTIRLPETNIPSLWQASTAYRTQCSL